MHQEQAHGVGHHDVHRRFSCHRLIDIDARAHAHQRRLQRGYFGGCQHMLHQVRPQVWAYPYQRIEHGAGLYGAGRALLGVFRRAFRAKGRGNHSRNWILVGHLSSRRSVARG